MKECCSAAPNSQRKDKRICKLTATYNSYGLDMITFAEAASNVRLMLTPAFFEHLRMFLLALGIALILAVALVLTLLLALMLTLLLALVLFLVLFLTLLITLSFKVFLHP
eukprot:CAMPEP_0119350228 /NCGR_PEP_ID=MMETSP1333-20130426/109952_1 /TAXON_ID=418940 /ORGANISM="Scyphosphaera apsteinii, Strain RCC1455" /LENGTH=109 /DNA_ID=CAMNT_0007362841 /DNA_START=174 /DNA_END=502 /DNA_ORIENTATION=-